NARLQALQDRSQKLLFPMERLLRFPALSLLLELAKRPAHRGRQTGQTMLEDIVRGPGLKALDGRLFANRSGNQDEGDLRRSRPRDPQGGQAVEIREPEIGEDQIDATAFEG